MTAYHDPRNLDEAMREIRYLRDASRKHNIVVKERNELRAKIAALEGQEQKLDYFVLQQFADDNAISYNKLCTAVKMSIITAGAAPVPPAYIAAMNACKEFVRKCEAGEAKSHASYTQMIKAIAMLPAAPKDAP